GRLALGRPHRGEQLGRARRRLAAVLGFALLAHVHVLPGSPLPSFPGVRGHRAAFYHSRVADTTPSMEVRLRSTVLSCSRCPTVTWKVFTARPSSVVRHLAWEMFTPCSVNVFEMAASSPGRSVQVTWTATGRSVFDSSSHETSTRRAGSRSSAFGQSRVWMTTPCPRLMKPTMSSPGTGVQHL